MAARRGQFSSEMWVLRDTQACVDGCAWESPHGLSTLEAEHRKLEQPVWGWGTGGKRRGGFGQTLHASMKFSNKKRFWKETHWHFGKDYINGNYTRYSFSFTFFRVFSITLKVVLLFPPKINHFCLLSITGSCAVWERNLWQSSEWLQWLILSTWQSLGLLVGSI